MSHLQAGQFNCERIKMGANAQRSRPSAFPRANRITESRDFTRVFRKNAVSSDRYFRVLARPNGAAESRIGLAISKKVEKRAVGRNRIKRIVRESFRTHRTGLLQDTVPCIDIVVLARPGIGAVENQCLFASLQSHWREIGKQTERRFSVKEHA